MSGKRNQSRNSRSRRSHSRNNRRNQFRARLVYVISILVLTALVGAAFYSPGWVFAFQDRILCSGMTLEERESVDVAVLSTNYESSFYQRMINFAESQTENTNYYVASEDLTDYEQLQEFLHSEHGLYQDSFGTLINAQLIDDWIFDGVISVWKQYVIYSDDYAKGVNFILWYIELVHPDKTGGTYKLLLEADTGELYGLHADTGGEAYTKFYFERYNEYSLEQYLSRTSDVLLNDGWIILAYFYSGLTESDFFNFYELYYGAVDGMYGDLSIEDFSSYTNTEMNEIRLKLGIIEENTEEEQWLEFLRTYPVISVWDGGNRLECNFPYGEGSLIFRMQVAESVKFPWQLQDVTIGFPAIYELIPEFG